MYELAKTRGGGGEKERESSVLLQGQQCNEVELRYRNPKSFLISRSLDLSLSISISLSHSHSRQVSHPLIGHPSNVITIIKHRGRRRLHVRAVPLIHFPHAPRVLLQHELCLVPLPGAFTDEGSVAPPRTVVANHAPCNVLFAPGWVFGRGAREREGGEREGRTGEEERGSGSFCVRNKRRVLDIMSEKNKCMRGPPAILSATRS